MRDAAPELDGAAKGRTAVVIGSSIGGQHTQDAGFEEIRFGGGEGTKQNPRAK